MGHEYCGIVEEVGSAVKSVKAGHFVIGSFFASDNACPTCRIGYQSSCQHRELVGGAQSPLLRVPLADGTLVATPDVPSADLIPHLLTLSDRRALRETNGRKANHRHEPSRVSPEARSRIWCDGHSDGARR